MIESFEFLQHFTFLSGLCLLIGFILLIIEMFYPSFGAFGITGIILVVVGIALTAKSIYDVIIMAIIVLLLFGVVFAIFLRSVTKGKLKGKLILSEKLDKINGFSATDELTLYRGQTGKAITDLRPAGMAEVNGIRLDVVTEGSFIEKGTNIIVIDVEGNKIIVRSLK